MRERGAEKAKQRKPQRPAGQVNASIERATGDHARVSAPMRVVENRASRLRHSGARGTSETQAPSRQPGEGRRWSVGGIEVARRFKRFYQNFSLRCNHKLCIPAATPDGRREVNAGARRTRFALSAQTKVASAPADQRVCQATRNQVLTASTSSAVIAYGRL